MPTNTSKTAKINQRDIFDSEDYVYPIDVEYKDGKISITQYSDEVPGLIVIPESHIEKLFKAIKSVLPVLLRKIEHNKKYYTQNKPFPVRLGVLKEIIQAEAFKEDQSSHWIILKALDKQFYPQLKEMGEMATANMGEMIRLIKLGLTFSEAMEELKINEKVFIIGLSEKQCADLCSLLGKKERETLIQKKGYYRFMLSEVEGNKQPAKVVEMPEKEQLAFFY